MNQIKDGLPLLIGLLVIILYLSLVGCSSAPIKNPYLYDVSGNQIPRSERTIACIERLLAKDVLAIEASDICTKLFMRKK